MNIQEKIEQHLNRFKCLQKRHTAMLYNGTEAQDEETINQLIFERNQAFENLKNELSTISEISKTRNHPAFEGCRRRVVEILEKEKILKALVKDRKDKLTAAMDTTRRGRKILKGYQGAANRPGHSMKLTG